MASAIAAERLDVFPSNMNSGFLPSPPESSESEIFTSNYNHSFNYSTTDRSKLVENRTCGNICFKGSAPAVLLGESRSVSTGAVCVGCGGSIRDPFILRVAPNLEWHAHCLKCCECGQNLDENCTCFIKNGKTYCKQDYARLFGKKCSNCGLGFSADDFVMRAKDRVYHIDCFRCMTCQTQLLPGEEYALRADGLLCREDHHLSVSTDVIENNHEFHCHSKFSPPPGNVLSSPINGLHTTSGISGHSRHVGSGHKRKDTKTTRVRTVLNEKQLHTLRTCYAANCRPDALMKEQLTEMTGLSARVIRVWFQNKRCKDKKRSMAMKQLQEQKRKQQKNGEQNGSTAGSNLSGINGVAMIASEPVRNDSADPKPVQVQNYQQPAWKTLSDFALQSELEQSAFPQLMRHFSDHGQSSTSDSSEICSIPSVSSASIDIGAACSTPISAEASASVCG